MKKYSELQQALLHLLEDGQCHNGNELGQILKVSRTTIWKQVNQLIEYGLPIDRKARQGYQLTQPFVMLNEQDVRDQLSLYPIPERIQLHFFASIDSTNRYLRELPASTNIEVCCAETQTQGRGRFTRTWFSPFGENIYCSLRWNLSCDLSKLSGLSLIVSLALAKTIKHIIPNEKIGIKWPNDLLWQGRKLCGSLIEIIAETNGNAMIIIGVGLNTNSKTENTPLPDKAWCSLFDITGQYYQRNDIIGRLIGQFFIYLKAFLDDGFQPFMREWADYDCLMNKYITVTQPTGQIRGIAKGVTLTGQLRLIDDHGVEHHLSSGDTSLNTIQ